MTLGRGIIGQSEMVSSVVGVRMVWRPGVVGWIREEGHEYRWSSVFGYSHWQSLSGPHSLRRFPHSGSRGHVLRRCDAHRQVVASGPRGTCDEQPRHLSLGLIGLHLDT